MAWDMKGVGKDGWKSAVTEDITYLVIGFYVVSSDDGGSSDTNIHADVPIRKDMLCKHNAMLSH